MVKNLRKHALTALLSTLLILCANSAMAQVSTDEVYVSLRSGSLWRIDPVTVTATKVCEDIGNFSDIAFDDAGNLYGLRGGVGQLESININVEPCTTSIIGAGPGRIGGPNGLAFDTDGTFYASTFTIPDTNFGGGSLYSIDRADGVYTLVGANGVGCRSAGDIEFDNQGRLFESCTDNRKEDPTELAELDPLSGAGVIVSSLEGAVLTGLAYSRGVLYGYSADHQQYIIDPDAGTISAGTPIPGMLPDPLPDPFNPDTYSIQGAASLAFRFDGLDLKPQSFPNALNICGNGVAPLAFVGGSSDFNDYEVVSILIGNISSGLVGRGNKETCLVEDVTGDYGSDGLQSETNPGSPDGLGDLVCHVPMVDLRESDLWDASDVKSGTVALEVCVELDSDPDPSLEGNRIKVCASDSVYLTKHCN